MTTTNHTESFNTCIDLEQYELDIPPLGQRSPPYSWHTDDELLDEVYRANGTNQLMYELALRLELAIYGCY